MRIRNARGAAVVLTAGLVLTACATGTSGGGNGAGGDGGDGGGSGITFDPEAELDGGFEIMGFGLGDEVATARFERAEEALGDGVDIQHVEGALDIQQFLTSVASGNPPEIIYTGREQIGSFASRGAIMPLTECIAGEGIEIESFRENALAQVTFNDEVYGIPEFNTVQVTMANSDLLDGAGLTIEDVNGSDWDALAAANEDLHQADGGLSVIGYDPKLPEFFPLWARSNGTDLISEDSRTAQLNDPAVVEALEFAIGLYEAQGGFGAVKAYRDTADFFGSGNQFASNTLGAMPMEQWYINVLNESSPDAPVAFDAFVGKDGTPLAYAGGSAWAIPTDGENPEAACRFARVMTELDSWTAAAEARIELRAAEGGTFTGILTGNTEADEAVRDMIEPTGDDKWDSAIEAMYEANDYAFNYSASPADAEFKTAWEDAVNRVLNGQEDVQTALDRAQEEAQGALDEGWESWDES